MFQDTGRERLVRGDGEIIEEIVSKNRQKEINRFHSLYYFLIPKLLG